jgi:hypothetical protein
VENLLSAKTVYRKFKGPIGNVKINAKQPYSIRGYFLPSYSSGYQFMTYAPLIQYWEITDEGSLIVMPKTVNLDSKAFRKVYANKMEVLQADELSIFPNLAAPCVNVKIQTPSMYKFEGAGSSSG